MNSPMDVKHCPWCGGKGGVYAAQRFRESVLRYRKCKKCGATWKSSERFLEKGNPPLAERSRGAVK